MWYLKVSFSTIGNAYVRNLRTRSCKMMVTFSAESYIFGSHTNVAGFKQISLTSWFIRQRLQLAEVSKLTVFLGFA